MYSMNFEAGELIFKKGTTQYCLYEIISGSVDIISSYEGQGEKVLATLNKGRIFGELGLIEHMPRSATAIASADTVLRVVNEDEFRDYLVEDPTRMRRIYVGIIQRIRELSAEYESICADITKCYDMEMENAPKSLKDRLLDFFRRTNEIMADDDGVMSRYYSEYTNMY